MQLRKLLEQIEVLDSRGSLDRDVSCVTRDSRTAVDGSLYCYASGPNGDQRTFVADAASRGAGAVVAEGLFLSQDDSTEQCSEVVVADSRAALGPIAAAFHGHPSKDLQVVGVTGTNGKTTTTHLLDAILEAHGWKTGVIGTLGGVRTTPDAPALQELLARFRHSGHKAVALEVSSHALHQRRVDGTRLAAAVFTNLSQDHLDYHETMEEYFSVKARMFSPEFTEHAVINEDDPWGQELLRRVRGIRGIVSETFSVGEAKGLEFDAEGSRFRWDGRAVLLHLGGIFNVSNALAAAHAARIIGVPSAVAAAALSSVRSIPGRFEYVDEGQPFTVVVDYAHTPDGLEKVLIAARQLALSPNKNGTPSSPGSGGRVIVVFGCGGGRDSGKRPIMGEIASRLADQVFLTSDNPRDEEPLEIIGSVEAGMSEKSRLIVEPDRPTAIAGAIASAQYGDVVIIAGKGHEITQTIGPHVLAMDDRSIARAAVAAQVKQ